MILVSSFLYWFYLREDEKEYWTMDEVLGDLSKNIGKPVNREKYLVRDKVTYVEEATFPKYFIRYFKATEESSPEKRFMFDTNKSVSLLAVSFESLKNKHTFFTSENHTFKEGEYNTFTLPVKEYPVHELYRTNQDYWKTVEPAFLGHGMFIDYINNIVSPNEQVLSNISKEISVNNVTNSFHCNLTFNSVSDFYPHPVKWKHANLGVSEDFREEHFDDYYIKVYHEDTYLGRLESNDSDLDKFIEPGDRIEIAGFNYSGIQEDISIGFDTSHPLNIEYEVSTISITPHYKIYFEE